MIIGFSGLDGCGKSTIIKLITKEIDQNRSLKDAEVVWTRVGYTPVMNFMKQIARLLLRKKLPKSGKSKERTKALKNSYIQQLWITLSLIELIWIFGVKIRVKSVYKTLLLDRQIDDSIIDLQVMFGREIIESKKYRILIRLLSKLSTGIRKVALDIDIPTSDYRCSIKFEPFPDSPEDKIKRFKLYQEAFKRNQFELVLDGIKHPELNLNVIQNTFYLKDHV